MPAIYPIAKESHLLYRLSHAIKSDQKVTFLLGSGLTLPDLNSRAPGVPSAFEMIDRVKRHFQDEEESNDLEILLKESTISAQYQKAMEFMIRCRGQSALNSLIRSAVLEARLPNAQSGIPDNQLER